MFNYYNPCSMCCMPIYFKGMSPMMPMGYGYMNNNNVEENDDDLKNLYPKMYFKMYPLVKQYCDMMEEKNGEDYCPSEKEMNSTCKEIYEKIKPELDDDENDYTRQRRYRRRHAVRDIARILLVNELLGRRRGRRRRRRRRYYNYYNPYYNHNYGYNNNYNDDDYYEYDDSYDYDD
ncbi:hypothetical protein NRP93_003403 [Clostridium botulinum]|nr:hypothetical protein [Clostridium botulinum]